MYKNFRSYLLSTISLFTLGFALAGCNSQAICTLAADGSVLAVDLTSGGAATTAAKLAQPGVQQAFCDLTTVVGASVKK